MIPTIGFIIAAYAIARLLQTIDTTPWKKGHGIWQGLVSICAILILGILVWHLASLAQEADEGQERMRAALQALGR